jgi:hypothetical protein
VKPKTPKKQISKESREKAKAAVRDFQAWHIRKLVRLEAENWDEEEVELAYA